MTPTPSSGGNARPKRRIGATPIAIAIGVPLGAGVLALFQFGPLKDSAVSHYLEHFAEQVEMVLCCIALSALGEGPSGFSLEASLITLSRPNSRLTSSIGLPGG